MVETNRIITNVHRNLTVRWDTDAEIKVLSAQNPELSKAVS